jgi:hypothetical protein
MAAGTISATEDGVTSSTAGVVVVVVVVVASTTAEIWGLMAGAVGVVALTATELWGVPGAAGDVERGGVAGLRLRKPRKKFLRCFMAAMTGFGLFKLGPKIEMDDGMETIEIGQ